MAALHPDPDASDLEGDEEELFDEATLRRQVLTGTPCFTAESPVVPLLPNSWPSCQLSACIQGDLSACTCNERFRCAGLGFCRENR